MILDALLNRPKDEAPRGTSGRIFPRRTAGVLVNEETALTYSAVYLSIKIISETIAALPHHTYTRQPGSTNKKIAFNHPVNNLLLRPNSEMTGFNFMRTLLAHAALRGNGYSYIDRDRSNRPGELQLITPDRVNKARSKATNEIVYEVSNGTSANDYLSDAEMFHVPGLGFDGLLGYSVVNLAARSFGLGMAAEEFGAAFYENGAQLGTVIEVPPEVTLDEAGKDLLLDSFDAKHKSVRHHHRTALIDQGMKVSSMGIPQKDAQFIESRKFSVTDVARWFNMPPHKLKDLELTTVGNIEEQNIGFVQDTLMPWVVNLEQTISWKLLGQNNRNQFLKINLNGLLRGDSAARAAYYRDRFNMGSLSINEIKAYEDENGIGPDGDQHFMQMNMTTVEQVVNPPEPKPAPTFPPAAPENDDAEDDTIENLQRFRPLIENALKKPFLRIEDKRHAAAALDVSALSDFLVKNLDNRREYIAAHVRQMFYVMTNREPRGADDFVDILIATCRNHYLMEAENKENVGTANVLASLTDDFIEYCARIIAEDNG